MERWLIQDVLATFCGRVGIWSIHSVLGKFYEIYGIGAMGLTFESYLVIIAPGGTRALG